MHVPKVIIMMADYGHDPTETAVAWQAFQDAGFEVHLATEHGKAPECDRRMLEGLTQKLLGATAAAIESYNRMLASPAQASPYAWTSPFFTLEPYDLVYLPGGHDKAVRQVIDSTELHKLLIAHWPLTRRDREGRRRAVAAVCHGVQVLSAARGDDGRSVLWGCETTCLPARFEQMVFWGTRAFLGDYYKTYGAGSENVEHFVRKALQDDGAHFKSSLSLTTPFIVEDKTYNYISARWPGDVQEMSARIVELVKTLRAD